MQLKKPEVSTIRVTALDVESGKSKTITVYSATPEKVIADLKRLAEADEVRPMVLRLWDIDDATAKQTKLGRHGIARLHGLGHQLADALRGLIEAVETSDAPESIQKAAKAAREVFRHSDAPSLDPVSTA